MSEVRLIDANALKYKKLAEVDGKLTHVLTAEEINNAPTVEPEVYMTAKDYNLYLEGYKQGRKTLTIPAYLDAQAKEAGINFSAVLQEALLEIVLEKQKKILDRY